MFARVEASFNLGGRDQDALVVMAPLGVVFGLIEGRFRADVFIQRRSVGLLGLLILYKAVKRHTFFLCSVSALLLSYHKA